MDPMARRQMLVAAAVTLFSLSGGLIMQLPREDRRTLFIFPVFLAVVIGGSLAVYGYENVGAWLVAGPVVVPLLAARLVRRITPNWLLILLSYAALIGAIVCADLLLDSATFR